MKPKHVGKGYLEYFFFNLRLARDQGYNRLLQAYHREMPEQLEGGKKDKDFFKEFIE